MTAIVFALPNWNNLHQFRPLNLVLLTIRYHICDTCLKLAYGECSHQVVTTKYMLILTHRKVVHVKYSLRRATIIIYTEQGQSLSKNKIKVIKHRGFDHRHLSGNLAMNELGDKWRSIARLRKYRIISTVREEARPYQQMSLGQLKLWKKWKTL